MPGKLERLDAPGIRAEGTVLQTMRREVANLLRRQQLGFPGAQPVSFTRKHVDELRKQECVLYPRFLSVLSVLPVLV